MEHESKHLDYARPSSHRKPASFLKVYGTLFGGVIFILLSITVLLMPTFGRARECARVIQCGTNFLKIGQLLVEYANEFGGRYPDYIEQVLWQGDWSAVLTCPSSNEMAVRGATPDEVMAKIASEPGHVSYTYIGRGLTLDVPPHTVMAYEVLGHHPPKEGHKVDGSNVLFADGKVAFVPAADMTKLIQQLSAGANPPPIAKKLYDSAP